MKKVCEPMHDIYIYSKQNLCYTFPYSVKSSFSIVSTQLYFQNTQLQSTKYTEIKRTEICHSGDIIKGGINRNFT